MAAVYVFSDEGGDFKERPCFLVGMLITSDHVRIEAEITKRRQAAGYADRELKYSTTDRLKVDFGRSVIDLFVETVGHDFRCIVK
jgi:hypothetical protein